MERKIKLVADNYDYCQRNVSDWTDIGPKQN